MTETAARPDGRTHYEAVLDVRYGVRFNDMCERLYNRVDAALTFVTLLGSSTAAVAFVNKNADTAALAGLVLGAASILALVLSGPRKAEQHAQAKRAYAALDARAPDVSLRELDAELRVLQAASPSGIALLARPAYNANLLTAGRAEHVVPLHIGERLLQALA